MVSEDHPGAIVVHGCVLDGANLPVTDAMLEFWQADGEGRVSTPPSSPSGWTGFSRTLSDMEGGYRLVTVKPGRLRGTGALEAPHIDVSIFARGLLQRLVTRIYFSDEEANTTDPVLVGLGRSELRRRLVAQRSTQDAHPSHLAHGAPAYRLDIHLQGEQETVFFAPW